MVNKYLTIEIKIVVSISFSYQMQHLLQKKNIAFNYLITLALLAAHSTAVENNDSKEIV